VKEAEKQKIRMLDVQGTLGTIQSVLMDPNINQASYPEVLYYLLAKSLEEKSYFERTTNNMMKVLRTHNLFDEINWALELEEK
jgi:hypothetical protein